MKTKRIALCGVLLSLALVLSYVERFIPLQLLIPLPGVKLGLANIITLLALYLLSFHQALAILLCRCILSSLFGGGVTGLLFSLIGGLLSLLIMALFKKSPQLSVYGVSILGAASHNIGQIAAAMVMMHSVYVGAYLPYLLLTALLTGTSTGFIAAGVLRIIRTVHISAHSEMHR